MIYKSTAATDPWTYEVGEDGTPLFAWREGEPPRKITPGSGADKAIRDQVGAGQLEPAGDLPEMEEPEESMPNMASGGIGEQPFDETADKATAGNTEKQMRKARGYPEERNSVIDRLVPSPILRGRADQLAEDLTRTADDATAGNTERLMREKRAQRER